MVCEDGHVNVSLYLFPQPEGLAQEAPGHITPLVCLSCKACWELEELGARRKLKAGDTTWRDPPWLGPAPHQPIPSTPSSAPHTPLPSSPVKLPEWSSISPFLAFAPAFPMAPPLLSYSNKCGPLDLRSWFPGDPPLTIQLALVHSTCRTVHPSIITYTALGSVVGFHVVSHQTKFLEVGAASWPFVEWAKGVPGSEM